MDDDLDWDALRIVLRAAQAGTLAGAARVLGVEHSTVARRLSAAERALGGPLFVRARDGLHATPLARKLLPQLEAIDRAVREVRQNAAPDAAARVRLAMPTGFTALFSARLDRLTRRHPGLTLELLSGARPVDLKRGEADLAIRSGPVGDPDLVARPLGRSGWSLYASPAYLARHPAPDDPDDLRGHELIGYDAALAMVPAAQWVEAHAPGATIVLRSRELADMQAAAAGGAGIALLPCLGADADPGLRRLTPRVLATRELWLVYPREMRVAPAVRAVAAFVVEVMREAEAQVGGAGGPGA